jgi:hypothetical protein
MSDLERGFEELPGGGGPPEGWQDKVLARIDTSRAHARWPVLVAGSAMIAAAAAIMLFFASRTPDKPAARPMPAETERREALFERLESAVHGLVRSKDEAYQQLLQARTEAERALAEKALDDARKELENVQRQLDKVRVRMPSLDRGKVSIKCDPNDPLCGVN